jgi:hypothetical protein
VGDTHKVWRGRFTGDSVRFFVCSVLARGVRLMDEDEDEDVDLARGGRVKLMVSARSLMMCRGQLEKWPP